MAMGLSRPGLNSGTYGEDPVDGQCEHLPNAQQVDECPEEGGDERCDHDEEEKVCGSEECGRGCGHADDSKDLEKWRKRGIS